MSDFLTVLARNATDTAAYLLAYRGAPVVALLAAVLLARYAPNRRLLAWARRPRIGPSMLGAAALGMTGSLAGRERRTRIGQLSDRPSALVAYLATSHALTAYYLLLMGPLLGKDVLLSHVIGVILFTLFAAGACHLLGWGAEDEPATGRASAAEPESRSLSGLALSEGARAVGLMLLGLLLGGAVAAWGLTGRRVALVELVGAGGLAQVFNGLLAAAISAATFVVPVTNLFVGTYLWKVGLAHAGLVVFLVATSFSPQRAKEYHELLGAERARRLLLALVVGALLAGLATAALYAVTPLSINYKLIPDQMW